MALEAQPQDIQGQFRVEGSLELTLGRSQGRTVGEPGCRGPSGLLFGQGREEILMGQEAGRRLKMGQEEVPVPELGQQEKVVQVDAIFSQALGPFQDRAG